MVAVVAGLGRQVEGDGQARLPLGQVLAVESIRLPRRRMPGVGAKDPGLVALSPCDARWLVRWLVHGCRLAGPAPLILQCTIRAALASGIRSMLGSRRFDNVFLRADKPYSPPYESDDNQ